MIPSFPALPLEDIPDDQREWAEKWAKTLNSGNAMVTDLLSGRISLSENTTSGYYKFPVTGGTFPIQIGTGTTAPATGVLIVRAEDIADPTKVVGITQIQWVPKGDQVIIKNVTGLTSGRRYRLTVLVLFDNPTASVPVLSLAAAPIINATTSDGSIPIISDWLGYTPAWTAPTPPTLGNGTVRGQWRRVGDSMQIQIGVIFGSTSAAGAGTWAFGLPPGRIIDLSKTPNPATTYTAVDLVGHAIVLDSGANVYSGDVALASTTTVNAFVYPSAGAYTTGSYVGAGVPIAFGASDGIRLWFEVPIVGWTSTTGATNV